VIGTFCPSGCKIQLQGLIAALPGFAKACVVQGDRHERPESARATCPDYDNWKYGMKARPDNMLTSSCGLKALFDLPGCEVGQ
jgi:hypothetical protein